MFACKNKGRERGEKKGEGREEKRGEEGRRGEDQKERKCIKVFPKKQVFTQKEGNFVPTSIFFVFFTKNEELRIC